MNAHRGGAVAVVEALGRVAQLQRCVEPLPRSRFIMSAQGVR
ncbi:hypothetical protein [Variovorax gossypii]|nr:hypothetical protein [Variovorax gossypii]MDP9603725.1 hypothetical protein [Variovorax paradoxus]